MQIKPQDLGIRRCIGLMQRRLQPTTITSTKSVSLPELASVTDSGGERSTRLGLFGRYATRGMDLPLSARARLREKMDGIIYGSLGGFFGGSLGLAIAGLSMLSSARSSTDVILGGIFVAITAALWGTGFQLPGILVRNTYNRPLQTEEIEGWLSAEGGVTDTLDVEFLRLVRDAMRQSVASPLIEQNLRDSIRALADAIDRVPRIVAPIHNENALQGEIAEIRYHLSGETDPVIVESRHRRIAALEQSLRNVQRNARVGRRAEALREELLAQIGALRMGLSSLETETGENLPALTTLADSVRRVAAEAGALADAREELDATSVSRPIDEQITSDSQESRTIRTNAAEQPQTLRIGRNA
jgi:hypothetical protein